MSTVDGFGFLPDEPTSIVAFHHHVEQTWERIVPRNKEKAHVIAWLSRQIELIPQPATSKRVHLHIGAW